VKGIRSVSVAFEKLGGSVGEVHGLWVAVNMESVLSAYVVEGSDVCGVWGQEDGDVGA
jgi:ABC-type sugar transport system substrate-binding protein